MAYKNGQIPSSALTPVTAQLGPFLRSDAAAAVKLLQAAFLAHFGIALVIVEAYRNLDRQKYLYAGWIQHLPGFNLAITPGRSNHGWAIACDFGSSVNVYGSAQKTWMDANAPLFGWRPAGNGFTPREAWHFEFVGNPTITTISQVSERYSVGAPIQHFGEDDMSQQDINDIKGLLVNIQSLIATERDAAGNGSNIRALVNGVQATVSNVESILARETVNGVPGGIRGMVVQAVAETRTDLATTRNVESILAIETHAGTKGGIRARIDAVLSSLTNTPSASSLTSASDADLVAELTRRMKG